MLSSGGFRRLKRFSRRGKKGRNKYIKREKRRVGLASREDNDGDVRSRNSCEHVHDIEREIERAPRRIRWLPCFSWHRGFQGALVFINTTRFSYAYISPLCISLLAINLI